MAYTTIDDPSAHFQTKIWTGDGATSTRTITNDGNSDLQPDLMWGACRSDVQHKWIQDSSRGFSTGNKELVTNNTQVEGDTNAVNSGAYGWLGPSVTDGFKTSKGSVNSGYWNVNARTYVAWQWKANGGTTSTNTDGAVTSTVQVNSDAGFSILTYTMNSGSNETVGHGLGVTPDIIIYKARQRGDSNGFWSVYTTLIDGSLDYLKLNTTDAKSNSVLASPTTTTFVGAGSSTVAYRSFVAYCFASKQGYSKFGSYVGNGTGTSDGTFNGTFVYTGFKPAWVMVKRSSYSAGDGWEIWDSTRPPRGGSTTDGNYINNKLNAASTGAESGNVYDAVDFLSNGFKLRTGRAGTNASGSTYIYMAFAENPFVTSTGVPATAR